MQSHSQVVCTQRNKENIKKELERNTRRKTIDKILRLSQLCNLDPFQNDTIIVILLLNLKCVAKYDLLRAFFSAKSVSTTSASDIKSTTDTDKTESIAADTADMEDTADTSTASFEQSAANMSDNDTDDNERNACLVEKQRNEFKHTQLMLFDEEILKHLREVLPDIMNTVTDWLSLLEYIQILHQLRNLS